jgi:hypothetical protein
VGASPTVVAVTSFGAAERGVDNGHRAAVTRKLVDISNHAASGATPIVWIGGDPIEAGFATSLARPGGKITGVDVYAGDE